MGTTPGLAGFACAGPQLIGAALRLSVTGCSECRPLSAPLEVGPLARAHGVPLRPPVPPQRHDCPQLRRYGGAVGLGGRRPSGMTARHRRMIAYTTPRGTTRYGGAVGLGGRRPSGMTARSCGDMTVPSAWVGAASAARLPAAMSVQRCRCPQLGGSGRDHGVAVARGGRGRGGGCSPAVAGVRSGGLMYVLSRPSEDGHPPPRPRPHDGRRRYAYPHPRARAAAGIQRRRREMAMAAAVPPATAPTPAAAGMPTFAAFRPVR